MGDRLKEVHQKGQSPLKDLIIISAIGIIVLVMAIIFDAHEMIMKWARQYENWQVDELITMLIILSFTFALFSVRWTKNLRHEISERKRTEEELKKHRGHLEELVEQRISEIKKVKGLLWENQKEAGKLAQENAVVAEIGRIISSTLNINEVYKRFAEEVQKLIPFDRIVINTINIEKNTVINVYIAGKGIADREARKVYPLEGSGNAEMVRARSTLLIQAEDFNEYKERYPLLLSTFQAGFKSIMNVPLFSKGRIMGGLLLRSLTPYAYKDEEVRLAEKIGDQIAGTVANAQLYLELKKTEQDLKKRERQYRELFNDAPIGYHEIDTEGHITRVNQTELTMLGYTEEEMVGQPVWKLVGEEEKSRETVKAKLAGTLPPGHQFERTYQRKDGSPLPVLIEDRLLYDLEGRITGIRSVIQNITEIKKVREDLLKLNESLELRVKERTEGLSTINKQLQTALENVKTLRGFIPICASCKKIRDDKGYWNQIEVYIRDHSEAEFSHGICPECMKKLYPDLSED